MSDRIARVIKSASDSRRELSSELREGRHGEADRSADEEDRQLVQVSLLSRAWLSRPDAPENRSILLFRFSLIYSADGFKVGFDWTRAAFSPDGQYIAVGSADGSVFIWSIAANTIETILKGHT